MAHLPRLVLPGIPYHVTRRGNRRQQAFFEDGDFAAFLGDPAADEAAWKALRMSETSARTLGTAQWLEALEAQTGRTLKPQKRGPKPRRVEGLGVFGKLAP